jgi:hypothetical protein
MFIKKTAVLLKAKKNWRGKVSQILENKDFHENPKKNCE